MNINSDAKGLVDRERINRSNEKYNFTDWVYNKINPKPGMKILDIACGTGKQLLSIAAQVLPEGQIFGIDISEDALAIAGEKLQKLSLDGITLKCLPMDEVPQVFEGRQFDLIYSVYAFYYSKDMLKLLSELNNCLNNSGKILLFGPGANSNREIIDIINTLKKNQTKYYDNFLSNIDLNKLRTIYKVNNPETFSNEIVFTQTDDLMTWLQTSELNDFKLHDQIASSVKSIIDSKGHFNLSKETIAFSLSKKM